MKVKFWLLTDSGSEIETEKFEVYNTIVSSKKNEMTVYLDGIKTKEDVVDLMLLLSEIIELPEVKVNITDWTEDDNIKSNFKLEITVKLNGDIEEFMIL